MINYRQKQHLATPQCQAQLRRNQQTTSRVLNCCPTTWHYQLTTRKTHFSLVARCTSDRRRPGPPSASAVDAWGSWVGRALSALCTLQPASCCSKETCQWPFRRRFQLSSYNTRNNAKRPVPTDPTSRNEVKNGAAMHKEWCKYWSCAVRVANLRTWDFDRAQ